MGSDARDGIGRRAFLVGTAAGAGLLLARGFRGFDSAASVSRPYDQTLRELGRSLTARQRELVVFAADDPTRQIVNTQTVLERPHLGTLFTQPQRLLIERLYHSMLSAQGVDDFAETIAVEGRFDGCVFAIYGDPERPDAQAVLQGGHIMLRAGRSSNGAAFGGGISYGHQTGNCLWRIPGNSFAYHGDAANRLYKALRADERSKAMVSRPPHELVLQVQGSEGTFRGVRLGDLGDAGKNEAKRLVETVFAPHPAAARAEALDCIKANGGLEALHFAVYASHGFYEDMVDFGALAENERARRGDPYWQVWRLEGPGTVIHFKGYPHVHAYIQVVRDPARANIGSQIALADRTLEGAALGRLLDAALRRATGETLAYFGPEVPGRFCAGEITTGLAYALDPYRNHVSVATIAGGAMSTPLRKHLEDSGLQIDLTRSYRVATTDYLGGQPESFGDPERVESQTTLMRDAIVAELRANGVEAART